MPEFEQPPAQRGFRNPNEYRKLLDPDNTLPPVNLALHGEDPGENNEPRIEYYELRRLGDGTAFGHANLVITDATQQAFLEDIGIDERAMLGKGFGRSAYVELVKMLATRELRLRSGVDQGKKIGLSREAWEIWEWMREKGVARLVEDRGTTGNQQTYSYSLYEII